MGHRTGLERVPGGGADPLGVKGKEEKGHLICHFPDDSGKVRET